MIIDNSKIFVINLDKRPEKYKDFVAHATEFSILKYERVSGIEIDKKDFENPLGIPYFHPGDVGCAKSHAKVVAMAKSMNLPYYIVFEDDVLFRKGFRQLFSMFWKEVPGDWDLLYFGANHNNTNPLKVSDHVVKVNGSYTTHAMLIKSTMYDDLIEIWSNPYKQVDVLLSEFHSRYNCYCFSPNLAGQRPGYSDILNKDVDYSFLIN